MRRRAPRPLGEPLAALQDRWAPRSLLGDVQRVWPQAVGPRIAAEATPSGERGGVLTVTCASAVWAQELELMGPGLVEQINTALGGHRVTQLRCSARRR